MVNFADKARRESQARENASFSSSRVNHRQNWISKNKIHHFLLGTKGVSFGAPFDGIGLPSHNVTMCAVSDYGELPVAVFNLGYKQENTFPKTLDVSQLNNIMVSGNEITITLPKNEEGIANATGFYYGLDSAFTQHGKIFSSTPMRILVTYHVTSNTTSDAFATTSRFGKTTLLRETMSDESEFMKEFKVGANGKVNLGPITQAFVKIPEVGEIDPVTGRAAEPQYMITDRVTIKLISA
jgi:hypothetical protein